jgi:hypothetical protein
VFDHCIFTKGQAPGAREKSKSPLFEIARVLLRFDHIARAIVNANHRIV